MRCKGAHTWGKTAHRDGRECVVCHVTELELYQEGLAKKRKDSTDKALKDWDAYTAKEK